MNFKGKEKRIHIEGRMSQGRLAKKADKSDDLGGENREISIIVNKREKIHSISHGGENGGDCRKIGVYGNG